MILIIIHKGEASPEVLKKIGELIEKGHHAGVDQPPGVDWEYRKSRPGGNRPREGG